METKAKTCETYLQKCKTIQPENTLTVSELKDVFFSLQTNKSAGHDGISFNVVKCCFGLISTPLLNIFNLSLEKGIFPDEVKIVRVAPSIRLMMKMILEITDQFLFCLVSLKCSKELCIRDFLITYRKTTYYIRKKLAFKMSHSTKHAIIHLIDQINSSFEKNNFTLGEFIDLSKVFDTVDHHILISKLENYGVNGNNLRWFQSSLKIVNNI